MTPALKAWLLWLMLCLGSFWLSLTYPALSQSSAPISPASVPQNISRDDSLNLGLDYYEQGDYLQAIAQWQQALSQTLTPAREIALHRNLANAYQRLGHAPNDAIFHWQHVLELADTDPRAESYVSSLTQGQIRIEQAQLYDSMGQHQRALELLLTARDDVEGDRPSELARQGALGNAYSALGRYDKAITAHEASLALAQALDDPPAMATALSNLANAHSFRARRAKYQQEVAINEGEDVEAQRAQAQFEGDRQAIEVRLKQSLTLGEQVGGLTQVRSLLNAHRFLKEFFPDRQEEQEHIRGQIEPLLAPLPPSRDKVFALIYLAQQQSPAQPSRAHQLLETAIHLSRSIADSRAESFALGSLGALYEQDQQYDIALGLTQQAQFTAQEISAFDSLYRWQWQAGRIYHARGELTLALHHYRAATNSLDQLRGDLIATSRDLQFEFRDAVEPVYRELIALLLKGETPGTSQTKLEETLDILERLKLAELRNFFGDDCVDVAQSVVLENGQLSDTKAVIIYSIILDEATFLVLQKADGTLSSYRVPHAKNDIQREVNDFRSLLEKRGTNEYLIPAQRLYDWLVRPLEPDLEAIAPETLVFIQDGVLRKTPVAALHDGERFLVESYALATTPSLGLTTTSRRTSRLGRTLIAGLTVEIPPFAALNNVRREVREIQNLTGGLSLLDQEFTVGNLEQELLQNPYSIVHLATHGKFGVDAESTFLLAFDDHITIDGMDQLLRSRRYAGSSRQPLELLVLSACQTAAGGQPLCSGNCWGCGAGGGENSPS